MVVREGKRRFTHEDALKSFERMANLKNYWENERIKPFLKEEPKGIRWRLV